MGRKKVRTIKRCEYVGEFNNGLRVQCPREATHIIAMTDALEDDAVALRCDRHLADLYNDPFTTINADLPVPQEA